MADYRIICTTQVPVNSPTTHAHIVSVGTGISPDSYTETWTLAQVIAAIESRTHRFYTIGRNSGISAWVQVAWCSHCRTKIIKTVGDVTTDNNLDSLPRCG